MKISLISRRILNQVNDKNYAKFFKFLKQKADLFSHQWLDIGSEIKIGPSLTFQE